MAQLQTAALSALNVVRPVQKIIAVS